MIEAIIIAAFAICACAFEAHVTSIPQGPPTDDEFAASVEFERDTLGIKETEEVDQ